MKKLVFGEEGVEDMTKKILISEYKKNYLLVIASILATGICAVYTIVILSDLIKRITEKIIKMQYGKIIDEIVMFILLAFIYILFELICEYMKFSILKKSVIRLEDEVFSMLPSYNDLLKVYRNLWTNMSINIPALGERYVNVLFDLVGDVIVIIAGLMYSLSINVMCTFFCMLTIIGLFLFMKKDFLLLPKLEGKSIQSSNNLVANTYDIIENGEVLSFLNMRVSAT